MYWSILISFILLRYKTVIKVVNHLHLEKWEKIMFKCQIQGHIIRDRTRIRSLVPGPLISSLLSSKIIKLERARWIGVSNGKDFQIFPQDRCFGCSYYGAIKLAWNLISVLLTKTRMTWFLRTVQYNCFPLSRSFSPANSIFSPVYSCVLYAYALEKRRNKTIRIAEKSWDRVLPLLSGFTSVLWTCAKYQLRALFVIWLIISLLNLGW